jgi:hypothetical protein
MTPTMAMRRKPPMMAKASDFEHTGKAYGKTWGWNSNQQGDPVEIDEDEETETPPASDS